MERDGELSGAGVAVSDLESELERLRSAVESVIR
jgi:hypothetical protein